MNYRPRHLVLLGWLGGPLIYAHHLWLRRRNNQEHA